MKQMTIELEYEKPDHLPGVLACLRVSVLKFPGSWRYSGDGWAATPTPRLAEARERLQAALTKWVQLKGYGYRETDAAEELRAAWEACRAAERETDDE